MVERRHWFEDLADHMGEAYLRYTFTKGTEQEVEFLVGEMLIDRSMHVLDVGCGPGRHSLELARRGIRVTGIDISETFIRIAETAAEGQGLGNTTFFVADARDADEVGSVVGSVDRAICLCQGAFGMMRSDGDDERVLDAIARVLRPGGILGLSAFNAYFSIRHHQTADFDVDRGLSHERTEIKDPAGLGKEVSLWTGCYTPRELRLLLGKYGFSDVSIFGVEPGAYGKAAPSVDLPEFLVVARRV